MRPKTKPFAAKFRHTLEVLRLQGLQKKVSWLNYWVRNVCFLGYSIVNQHAVNSVILQTVCYKPFSDFGCRI